MAMYSGLWSGRCCWRYVSTLRSENWWKSLALILICVMSLTGCMGDQRQRQEASQPVTVHVPATVVQSAPDMKPVGELLSEVQASSNQTTNAITGLGVQVSKVAEKLEATLARVDAQVNATVNLKADVTAAMHAEIVSTATLQATATAQVVAQITNRLETQATATASLKAEVQALAQVQVGLKNSIETTTQTVTSGRDSHVQTIQFTREMMETLKASYEAQLAQTKSDNRTLFWTVTILMAAVTVVVVILQEASRRRAEARCQVKVGGQANAA